MSISEEERSGIMRGLADMEAGRVVSHSEVVRRYGL
jgi:predicted transcriptional regulator